MELIQDKIGGWWGKNPDDTAWVDWDFNDAIANTMGDLTLYTYLRLYVGQDLYDKTKNSIRVRLLLVQEKKISAHIPSFFAFTNKSVSTHLTPSVQTSYP